MEEIRNAALAAHENLSDEQKNFSKRSFEDLDSDGDGKITFDEFRKVVYSIFDNLSSAAKYFKMLDKDNDGLLDFQDVITVWFLFRTQRLGLHCDGCSAFLGGLYFTCVWCFFADREKNTFDLCCTCYRGKNFTHDHEDALFCDNYALLRSFRILSINFQDQVFQDFKFSNSIEEAGMNKEEAECSARERMVERLGKLALL